MYWDRNSLTIFKKEITLLINFNQSVINEIFRIDVIVCGVHGRGAFRFPIELLFVMKSETIVENTSSVTYITCKKHNGDILQNTIIDKLQGSFVLMLEHMTLDNQQVSISNIYITGDLVFFVIILDKELFSPKWCFNISYILKYG